MHRTRAQRRSEHGLVDHVFASRLNRQDCPSLAIARRDHSGDVVRPTRGCLRRLHDQLGAAPCAKVADRAALLHVPADHAAHPVAHPLDTGKLVAGEEHRSPGGPLTRVLAGVMGLGLGPAVRLRLVLPALVAHLSGTFLTFVMLPQLMFRQHDPFLLSADGEFVMKNLVLISAALVLIVYGRAPRLPTP